MFNFRRRWARLYDLQTAPAECRAWAWNVSFMRRLSTRTDFTFGFAAAICACWMIAAFFSDHFETGGKRSDIYSWISLRPYRNPEACIGVRLRMATSLFIWPVGNAQTLFSGISYSPYRNPEAGGCADVRPSASGFFFGFWFCAAVLFWRRSLGR